MGIFSEATRLCLQRTKPQDIEGAMLGAGFKGYRVDELKQRFERDIGSRAVHTDDLKKDGARIARYAAEVDKDTAVMEIWALASKQDRTAMPRVPESAKAVLDTRKEIIRLQQLVTEGWEPWPGGGWTKQFFHGQERDEAKTVLGIVLNNVQAETSEPAGLIIPAAATEQFETFLTAERRAPAAGVRL